MSEAIPSILCCSCLKKTPYNSRFCSHCGYNFVMNENGAERYSVALPMGTSLDGRYEIGQVLGQGGFGITYAAMNTATRELVAIKEFYPKTCVTRVPGSNTVSPTSDEDRTVFDSLRSQFDSEAAMLQNLKEFDGVVNVTGGDRQQSSLFYENGTTYLVMEYVLGISLSTYLKLSNESRSILLNLGDTTSTSGSSMFKQIGNNKGKSVNPLPWKEALSLLLPVMDIMAEVHQKTDIIHRDMTPDNIFLTIDNSVKLLDFGAAQYSSESVTVDMNAVLKHGFAPLEQYTGQHQYFYTDVYCLAASFYYSVLGRRPPKATDRPYIKNENLFKDVGESIVPGYIRNVLTKALAVNHQDRYQSMTAFKNALMQALQKSPDPRLPEIAIFPGPDKGQTIIDDDSGDYPKAKEAYLILLNEKNKITTALGALGRLCSNAVGSADKALAAIESIESLSGFERSPAAWKMLGSAKQSANAALDRIDAVQDRCDGWNKEKSGISALLNDWREINESSSSGVDANTSRLYLEKFKAAQDEINAITPLVSQATSDVKNARKTAEKAEKDAALARDQMENESAGHIVEEAEGLIADGQSLLDRAGRQNHPLDALDMAKDALSKAEKAQGLAVMLRDGSMRAKSSNLAEQARNLAQNARRTIETARNVIEQNIIRNIGKANDLLQDSSAAAGRNQPAEVLSAAREAQQNAEEARSLALILEHLPLAEEARILSQKAAKAQEQGKLLQDDLERNITGKIKESRRLLAGGGLPQAQEALSQAQDAQDLAKGIGNSAFYEEAAKLVREAEDRIETLKNAGSSGQPVWGGDCGPTTPVDGPTVPVDGPTTPVDDNYYAEKLEKAAKQYLDTGKSQLSAIQQSVSEAQRQSERKQYGEAIRTAEDVIAKVSQAQEFANTARQSADELDRWAIAQENNAQRLPVRGGQTGRVHEYANRVRQRAAEIGREAQNLSNQASNWGNTARSLAEKTRQQLTGQAQALLAAGAVMRDTGKKRMDDARGEYQRKQNNNGKSLAEDAIAQLRQAREKAQEAQQMAEAAGSAGLAQQAADLASQTAALEETARNLGPVRSHGKAALIAILAVALVSGLAGAWFHFSRHKGDGTDTLSLTSTVAIEALYDDARNFHDGLAAVCLDGKWGYIDTSGETVIPFEYELAWMFNEGHAVVADSVRQVGERTLYRLGFVNKSGSFIQLPPTVSGSDGVWVQVPGSNSNYQELVFHDDRLFVIEYSEDALRFDIFTAEGSAIAFGASDGDLDWQPVGVCSDHFIPVWAGRDYCGWANKIGDISTRIDLSSVSDNTRLIPYPFDQGIARVGQQVFNDEGQLVESSYGFMTQDAEWTVSAIYQDIKINPVYGSSVTKYFGDNGLAVAMKADKWGAIDQSGEEIIPFEYDDLYASHEGMMRYGQGNLYGFLDAATGEPVIEAQYDIAGDFNRGYAAVSAGGTLCLIDSSGNVIEGSEGLALFNNSFGLVTPDEYLIFYQDGKYGYKRLEVN